MLLGCLVGAAAAVLLSGCGSGEDVTTTAAPPSGDNAQADPGQPNPAGPSGGPGTINFNVTSEQRAYLDALFSAGVHRSNDLMALSIGSYVCQARAAGQSDQGVWDFVFPLVRGDVHDMNPSAAMTSMAAQVRDATAQYIRIATEQLCSGEHSP
ncbi:DUF732 domain-containing protein [Mycolicibacterium komossense]|uniref:DUF732 domain-containing protein n=1 Tax=Mycolicibacterium komossense TaxID=1779 RepID=A0ABT3CA81_9MYCO|nr:DUF732 domain-containing protein [Mycolicibacterium komossense]